MEPFNLYRYGAHSIQARRFRACRVIVCHTEGTLRGPRRGSLLPLFGTAWRLLRHRAAAW
jgi:hypothetical protein